jgi:hypothetical protein
VRRFIFIPHGPESSTCKSLYPRARCPLLATTSTHALGSSRTATTRRPQLVVTHGERSPLLSCSRPYVYLGHPRYVWQLLHFDADYQRCFAPFAIYAGDSHSTQIVTFTIPPPGRGSEIVKQVPPPVRIGFRRSGPLPIGSRAITVVTGSTSLPFESP